jgi:adenylate cyclase
MGQEIERKYLVSSDAWRVGLNGLYCQQGYLVTNINRTVRVRVLGNQGFITVKGNNEGIRRLEYEYSIPVQDAIDMLSQLCMRPLIEKYRYKRNYAGHLWEIDEFLGQNLGLVVAEIELQSIDQVVELPDWVGCEITDDVRYLNFNLAKIPYATWHIDRA